MWAIGIMENKEHTDLNRVSRRILVHFLVPCIQNAVKFKKKTKTKEQHQTRMIR